METSCYLYILTFYFSLVSNNRLFKRHVYNSVKPLKYQESSYNVTLWVKQLHLQQCALVEVGDKFWGVFVEYRPSDANVHDEVEEYYLGLCDISTLRKWRFCPPAVETERPRECTFREITEISNQPTRVHRRLCDVSGLAVYAKTCNCSSGVFRGQRLHEVTGFPTCFVRPLPNSICLFGNVCGVFSCKASTINKIHTVKCNPQCVGGQPFCESTGPETTRPSQIDSYWTDWSEPFCDNGYANNTNSVQHSQALCINKNTGMGAMDCLGPGTNCCPPDAEKCKCHLYEEDGILKLSRDLKMGQPELYEVQQNAGNSRDGTRRLRRKIEEEPDDDIKKDLKKQTIKKKYFPGSGSKVDKDEEEVDDVKDVEDNNDEDVVLEDEEPETLSQTSEDAEKAELKQKVIPKPAIKESVSEETTTKDLDYTKSSDDQSKGVRIESSILYCQLFLFGRSLFYYLFYL